MPCYDRRRLRGRRARWAGSSMVGITMTMFGAVAFLAMLYIVGIWG
jgi:hypothetical protein